MICGAEELVGQAAAARDEAQLDQTLRRFRDKFGLAHAAYFARGPGVPQQGPIFVLTYPENWIRRYRERNYFEIDPILTSVPHADFPLDWSEVNQSNSDASEFFGDAVRHGVGRNGLSFPLRTIAGELATFTITSDGKRSEWDSMHWGQVKLVKRFADTFHRRMVLLRSHGGMRLSQKENTCLRLLMEGSTPKAAAGMLGVSENRVRTIVQNACRKLDSRTATQAVAKAVLYALIP